MSGARNLDSSDRQTLQNEDFIQTLRNFLAQDQTQLPEPWLNLRHQIESFLRQQSSTETGVLQTGAQQNINQRVRDKLHQSISQFLNEQSNNDLATSSEMINFCDDVFISGSEDNIYEISETRIRQTPSADSQYQNKSQLQTEQMAHSSRQKDSEVAPKIYQNQNSEDLAFTSKNYIPGGRIPSVDLEHLFSDEDDDEAFEEGSDTDSKGFKMLNHPLRLLSSSALKRDTCVKNETPASSKLEKKFDFIKIDLPEVLYESKPVVKPKVAPQPGNFLTLQSPARPLSAITTHTYETLKFDDPANESIHVYDFPPLSPKPSKSAHQLSQSPEKADLPGTHEYSTIDKNLASDIGFVKANFRKTDSGVFCVSFADPYSPHESLTSGSDQEFQRYQSTFQTGQITNLEEFPVIIGPRKPKTDSTSQFKRQFSSRFSLRIRRNSKESELGSVAVACPKNDRGQYVIPFEELDSPKKFDNQRTYSFKEKREPSSIKSRFSQLRSSIKRSISFKR